MTVYMYPQNLKTTANLWLWCLRDFAILCVGLLVSVLALTQLGLVLPTSAVANLYPFNFSGKTDPHGLYIGRDKYGSNVLVDFDRRADDKTNANILILGNSGQGKSYLLKGIIANLRESGKSLILLDAEAEVRHEAA